MERALVAMLSATGTRTQVARVRAEYPDQLDYSGDDTDPPRAAQLLFTIEGLVSFFHIITTCHSDTKECITESQGRG